MSGGLGAWQLLEAASKQQQQAKPMMGPWRALPTPGAAASSRVVHRAGYASSSTPNTSDPTSPSPGTRIGPFRTSFPYDRTLFWYPPHQARAARQLRNGLHHIDMVVEVRDARLPLTSVNADFDRLLGRRERLVLYNKADLAHPALVEPVTGAFRRYRNETVLFTTANQGRNVQQVIDFAVDKCRRDPQRFPYLSMVVVGNPNVGKSSLINALRRVGVRQGKVSAVGARAGVTTSIQTRVKIHADPPIYLVDTPGIYNPHIGNPMQGLKIALTGGTNDQLTELPNVADYLLFRMNLATNMRRRYPPLLGLPGPFDDIHVVLEHVARAHGYYLDRGKRGTGRQRLLSDAAPDATPTPPSPTAHPAMDKGQLAALLMGRESWRTIPAPALGGGHAATWDARDASSSGVEVDVDRAALHLLTLYRRGAFGRLTLDDCSPAALDAWFRGEGASSPTTTATTA